MQVASIILVCCASLAFAIKICPRNEVWSQCKGCELTCGQDENTPCPASCGPPGCECVARKGFRRNAQGKCVRKSRCGSGSGSGPGSPGSRKCGPNMEFNECGTACPEKCTDGGMPGLCGAKCVAGCFCKKGYVLEWEKGPCIPRSACRG